MIEVQYVNGPLRGGRSFLTLAEAETAAAAMREVGITVVSIAPAPEYPWPDAPLVADGNEE